TVAEAATHVTKSERPGFQSCRRTATLTLALLSVLLLFGGNRERGAENRGRAGPITDCSQRATLHWLRPVSRDRDMEPAVDRPRRAAFRRGIARNDLARRLRRSLLQQSAPSRQASPRLLGAGGE